MDSVINFICDPAHGASAEKNAEMRACMERPDVAKALHEFLMARDLSNFDPNKVPPGMAGTKLHEAMKNHSA